MKIRSSISSACLLLILTFSQAALAVDSQPDTGKPFAEKHVILQLSDQDRESVVLDVANNLIKSYGGPDMIDIEIVTFGRGVRLMFAESPHKARIASLVDNGVRFYVCKNTLDTMERSYGSRPRINPNANVVQAGVAHIIDQVGAGYILIKP